MNLGYINLALIILLLILRWNDKKFNQASRESVERRSIHRLNNFKSYLIEDLKNLREAMIGASSSNTYILLKNNPGNKKILDDIKDKSTLDAFEFHRLKNEIIENVDGFSIEKSNYN